MTSEIKKWIKQCGGVVSDEQIAEFLDADAEFVRGFGLGRGQACVDGAVLFLVDDGMALIDELESGDADDLQEDDDEEDGDEDRVADDDGEGEEEDDEADDE
jgi:hypothetical protein